MFHYPESIRIFPNDTQCWSYSSIGKYLSLLAEWKLSTQLTFLMVFSLIMYIVLQIPSNDSTGSESLYGNDSIDDSSGIMGSESLLDGDDSIDDSLGISKSLHKSHEWRTIDRAEDLTSVMTNIGEIDPSDEMKAVDSSKNIPLSLNFSMFGKEYIESKTGRMESIRVKDRFIKVEFFIENNWLNSNLLGCIMIRYLAIFQGKYIPLIPYDELLLPEKDHDRARLIDDVTSDIIDDYMRRDNSQGSSRRLFDIIHTSSKNVIMKYNGNRSSHNDALKATMHLDWFGLRWGLWNTHECDRVTMREFLGMVSENIFDSVNLEDNDADSIFNSEDNNID